jgi:hypothetical protein
VTSEPGETVFTVSLPLEPLAAEPAAPVDPDAVAGADDDADADAPIDVAPEPEAMDR